MLKRHVVARVFWPLMFLAGFGTASPLFAADQGASPRLLVHLLNYLAKDYGGAIGPGGVVLSEAEYREQLEFSQTAWQTSLQLPELAAHPEVTAALGQLAQMIAQKADAKEVSAFARLQLQQITAIAHVAAAPAAKPDLARGQAIYRDQCGICHGPSGRGDGPAGTHLDPKPANFTDAATMAEATPLHVFNTVRLGVQGTGMPAFSGLSEADTWDVSYAVLAMLPERRMELLEAGIPAATPPQTTPAGDAKSAALQPLVQARMFLNEAATAYASGDPGGAKALALQAYLEGIEPIEPRVRATDPAAASATEERMATVRAAIEAGAPPQELQAKVAAAMQQLDVLENLLSYKEMAPSMAFVATSSILLREGFEAVLLILALLGVIRASGAKRAAAWVHAGWLTAVAAGGVAWLFSGYLLELSGARREMMEAVTSLSAVAVLLFVGFWLHSRTEIGRWNRFLKLKVRAAVQNKSYFGLALIAFFAVFREAFETVLFLRTIWLSSGEQARSALGLGVVLTLAGILAMAWAVLRFSAHIPVRKLFAVSAVVMALLAVILTGKGLHSLQETGALTVTTPSVPVRFELLGIFPSYETMLPQLFIIGLIGVLWHFGRRASSPQTRAARSAVGQVN